MRAVLVPHSDIPAVQQVAVDADPRRRRRTSCSTSLAIVDGWNGRTA